MRGPLGLGAALGVALVAGSSADALAHVPAPEAVGRLRWNLAPTVLVPLVLTAAVYARGVRGFWARAGAGRGATRAQVALMAAGLACLGVALVTPLDALGAELASAHMVQHLVLIQLAAPLLVAAAPLPALLVGLPAGWGPALGRWWTARTRLRGFWRLADGLVAAAVLHAAALWFWHAPGPYQAALAHELLHDLEHLSFFLTSLLLWWCCLRPTARAAEAGAALVALLATMVHSGLLGALMTFAPTVWYPAYGDRAEAWGLSPLEDQTLAGLIMWVPGGLLYLLAVILIVARWLVALEGRRA
ncbi:MAG TPA: cytochrome c oxidase assembly protein [Geminicoccaceae bacterium]|nr:cytochrome c oxidase assembly protein [Geminicoccaceae bacterium]